MIQLNYRDSRPIYEQVKDGLRQLIINGVLTEGSRLPSVRELAVSLTITRTRSSAPTGSLRRRATPSLCPARAAMSAARTTPPRHIRRSLWKSSRR